MALDTLIEALKEAKFKLAAELMELGDDTQSLNTELNKANAALRTAQQKMDAHRSRVHNKRQDLVQVERAIKVFEKEQADDLDD